MSQNVPGKETPQMAFTTQAASSLSLSYLLGSGEKMPQFRWGFLKLWELVPCFHASRGAVPRIYQLGPQRQDGLQPWDLTGAWASGGTSRNAILHSSSSHHLPQDGSHLLIVCCLGRMTLTLYFTLSMESPGLPVSKGRGVRTQESR